MCAGEVLTNAGRHYKALIGGEQPDTVVEKMMMVLLIHSWH